MTVNEIEPVHQLDRTRLTVTAGPLVGPVLERVIGMLAARAGLPLDRLNDAVLIADAIAVHAPGLAPDGRLSVSIATHGGALDLRVGPLRAGGGARLLESAALPGVGNVIERLADALRVRDAAGGGEYVHVKVNSGG